MSVITTGAAATRWLFGPATDGDSVRDGDRATVRRGPAAAACFLRVLLGLMWLYNVVWKRPPDFGSETEGLYHWTAFAVSHPVFPPYSWVVERVVLPNIVPFGWGVLVAETAVAVLLLTGAWVRVAAVLGAGTSLAIAFSVAFAPHEWPWAYWLMIGAHVVVLYSPAGRVLAVDAVRDRVSSARSLGLVWGAAAVIAGAFSALNSTGDPLAPKGTGLVSTELALSLGEYNLAGGLVLALAGALVLVAAATRTALPGWAAAGAGLLAALSLYAQVGFTDPLLGGTATSAAFLLSVALVAGTVAGASRRARQSA
ncbi:hypothetical protein F4561_001345 [Lipingzhangella halophila]|uniref:DoxX family membrane protein n=1 Tax=Lipingzhangella halophila TaxID=1783352 RepID=A0A7W7W2D0_9ACTN|nr:hypothetical protein [Lipingzhangella halophila]MBB4930525.1 hypothetical protein [Lipingzhangella halophila]